MFLASTAFLLYALSVASAASVATPVACYNNFPGGSCIGSVTYTNDTTLTADLNVSQNVTIETTILTTNGFSIIAGGNFLIINGIDVSRIDTTSFSSGIAGGIASSGNGGNGSSASGSLGGSGGGGSAGATTNGGNGSNTAAQGGKGGIAPQTIGQNGVANAAVVVNNSNIAAWHNTGFKSKLSGGAGGAGGGSVSSTGINGLNGPYGIYIQASNIIVGQYDYIVASNFETDTCPGIGAGQAGGAGGAVIILAYKNNISVPQAGLFTSGTSTSCFGSASGSTGGNGTVIIYHYMTPPLNVITGSTTTTTTVTTTTIPAGTPVCTNNWQGGACLGNVTYTGNQYGYTILESNLNVSHDVTINPGVTLYTEGYAIWIGGNFANYGTLTPDGGIYTEGAQGSYGPGAQPYSYFYSMGGSGGGGGGSGIYSGGNGGNTSSNAGMGGAAGSIKGMPGTDGQAGNTNEILLNNANIVVMYDYNFINFLAGAGGGSGGGTPSTQGNQGGTGSLGIYLQATNIIGGRIDLSGGPAQSFTGFATGSGGGGGGGAAVAILSYKDAASYSYANVSGGLPSNYIGSGGSGGKGGNGAVLFYHYNTPPLIPAGASSSFSSTAMGLLIRQIYIYLVVLKNAIFKFFH